MMNYQVNQYEYKHEEKEEILQTIKWGLVIVTVSLLHHLQKL